MKLCQIPAQRLPTCTFSKFLLPVKWILLAVLVAACGIVGLQSCPSLGRPSVQLSIHNAATGEAIDGASAVIRDGAFADSVTTNTAGAAVFVFDRAGTYDVQVEKEGFETWRRSDVVVELNDCGHAETANLDADLLPLAS